MTHLPLSFMNRLNKIESAIFRVWMLYFQRIFFIFFKLYPESFNTENSLISNGVMIILVRFHNKHDNIHTNNNNKKKKNRPKINIISHIVFEMTYMLYSINKSAMEETASKLFPPLWPGIEHAASCYQELKQNRLNYQGRCGGSDSRGLYCM